MAARLLKVLHPELARKNVSFSNIWRLFGTRSESVVYSEHGDPEKVLRWEVRMIMKKLKFDLLWLVKNSSLILICVRCFPLFDLIVDVSFENWRILWTWIFLNFIRGMFMQVSCWDNKLSVVDSTFIINSVNFCTSVFINWERKY